jgi:hypothetical protein
VSAGEEGDESKSDVGGSHYFIFSQKFKD